MDKSIGSPPPAKPPLTAHTNAEHGRVTAHANTELHGTVIAHANAESYGTASRENLNPLGRVKYNSGGPIKSGPKLTSENLSPATTQFQMKSSPDTLTNWRTFELWPQIHRVLHGFGSLLCRPRQHRETD